MRRILEIRQFSATQQQHIQVLSCKQATSYLFTSSQLYHLPFTPTFLKIALQHHIKIHGIHLQAARIQRKRTTFPLLTTQIFKHPELPTQTRRQHNTAAHYSSIVYCIQAIKYSNTKSTSSILSDNR